MKIAITVIAIVVVSAIAYWYILMQLNIATAPTSLANPASVNCAQALGGTFEIIDTAEGQMGYCHLPDGRVCEEWGLYRNGSCAPPPATTKS